MYPGWNGFNTNYYIANCQRWIDHVIDDIYKSDTQKSSITFHHAATDHHANGMILLKYRNLFSGFIVNSNMNL